MNKECCEDHPKILCRNCHSFACKDHYKQFTKEHPPANKVTESGRDIYYCNESLVSFIIENGVIVLINPNDFWKQQ